MASRRSGLGRAAGFAALALLAISTPASAQGLFDMLFGGAPRPPRGYVPPQGSAYANPYGQPDVEPGLSATPGSGGTGRVVAYCVRLCDGRFFPMQRHNNATSVQLCNAFCPAAKTQIFTGSQIDHAVSSNGTRYASLDSAFAYREKIVDGCTCNGRDVFGLAPISAAADPTLRPGDIVATADGSTKINNASVTRTARNASRERPALRLRNAPPDDDLPED